MSTTFYWVYSGRNSIITSYCSKVVRHFKYYYEWLVFLNRDVCCINQIRLFVLQLLIIVRDRIVTPHDILVKCTHKTCLCKLLWCPEPRLGLMRTCLRVSNEDCQRYFYVQPCTWDHKHSFAVIVSIPWLLWLYLFLHVCINLQRT